jgi:hypothetical protein
MIALNSSNLAAAGYSGGNLVVTFRSGRVYEYFGVPLSVFVALLNATSHGSYFYWNIRKSYPYRRIQ